MHNSFVPVKSIRSVKRIYSKKEKKYSNYNLDWQVRIS